jgi:hypothetical protein
MHPVLVIVHIRTINRDLTSKIHMYTLLRVTRWLALATVRARRSRVDLALSTAPLAFDRLDRNESTMERSPV